MFSIVQPLVAGHRLENDSPGERTEMQTRRVLAPIDVIAALLIVVCGMLKATGQDGMLTGALVSISVYYFVSVGRRVRGARTKENDKPSVSSDGP
jgi:hypothetical protein